jgi:hypothetical protein
MSRSLIFIFLDNIIVEHILLKVLYFVLQKY